jgi:uncharacterized protein YjiS (DUF1127 family)
MDTSEILVRPAEDPRPFRVQFDPLGTLTRAWNALAQKIEERQTLHKLYQLDAHVLRDMGFDPNAIYTAYESAIGDLSAVRRRDL